MGRLKAPPLRLYHGTNEKIAKVIPVKGLELYDLPPEDSGISRVLLASCPEGLCLTSCYAGYMSFDSCDKDRWGIAEIEPRHLNPDLLFPHELYLIERSKKKFSKEDEINKALIEYRSKLESNAKLWKSSLDEIGLCRYKGVIPTRGITKIAIYNWMSNWTITKQVVNVEISTKHHKLQLPRQRMLTNWLIGGYVDSSDWVSGFSKLPQKQRDTIIQGLHNKMGLDIFYQNPVKEEHKPTWWR